MHAHGNIDPLQVGILFFWTFMNGCQVDQMSHGGPTMRAIPRRLQLRQMLEYLKHQFDNEVQSLIFKMMTLTH